jgi:hypothetical protein
MNRRHLPGNFVDDPKALFRKTRAKLKKTSSTLQHKASSKPEDRRSFIRVLYGFMLLCGGTPFLTLSVILLHRRPIGPGIDRPLAKEA